MQNNMITVSQDEYVRMLNLLKYQAEFILSNVKVEEIEKDKEESTEFLRMLNDLDLTFTDYLNAKGKYQITEESKKCIEKVEEIKEKLNKLANDNWIIEDLFIDKSGRHRRGMSSDKRLKENMVLLGTTVENINVYQFNYIFDPMKVKHVGVIAQELLETDYKDNVYKHEDGFYRVDYKHLDMTFDGQLLPYLAK